VLLLPHWDDPRIEDKPQLLHRRSGKTSAIASKSHLDKISEDQIVYSVSIYSSHLTLSSVMLGSPCLEGKAHETQARVAVRRLGPTAKSVERNFRSSIAKHMRLFFEKITTLACSPDQIFISPFSHRGSECTGKDCAESR